MLEGGPPPAEAAAPPPKLGVNDFAEGLNVNALALAFSLLVFFTSFAFAPFWGIIWSHS